MKIYAKDLPKLFAGVRDIFLEKKEELCELDANMGDGDLGLTMSKGFGEMPHLLQENLVEDNIGKSLFLAGSKMASVVPSTMGTLMASGIMEGGKHCNKKEWMEKEEMLDFLHGFYEGVKKRGKCEPGDRTLLDAMYAAYQNAKEHFADCTDCGDVLQLAVEGAKQGVEATMEMLPKFGKAAVFASKAKGIPDQGAVAGLYFLQGLARYYE